MVLKSSLIALVKEPSVFIQHAQNRIAGSVAALCPEAGCFENYTQTKDLLKALSTSFARSKVVIVCAERTLYLSLKKSLIQALHLDGEVSGLVTAAVQSSGKDISAEMADAHALIPKGASVFISDDGLYSGFAVQSGKQHLVVLPLDLERLDSIIENGFAVYIKAALASEEMLKASAAEPDDMAGTAEKLIRQGFSAAVAANKSAEFIKIKLSAYSGWENTFQFIACDEEKKGMSQKEYIANLALQARERAGCAVGIAISNVFTSDKELGAHFVLVTVADSVRARVAKVYAQPDETPRQLVAAAVDTLLSMLDEFAEADGFTGFPMNAEEPEMPVEELKGKRRIALKLILSGIAAVIICLIIIFFGGRMVSAVKDFSGRLRNADQTQTVSTFTDTSVEENSSNLSVDDLLSMLANMPSYSSEETGTSGMDDKTQSISVQEQSTSVTTTKTTTKPAKPPATSTKPTSTTAANTTIYPSTVPSQFTGSFSFTVKGYGHGVGMSQEGAKTYASKPWSWTYDAILLHYYTPGVTLLDDANRPASVTYGGNSIALIEYLARTVAKEIRTVAPDEALKAQTVAVYSFAKSYGFRVSSGQHAYDTAFNMDPNSKVVKAVNEVAGKYLSYNGNAITAFYFASTAGQTVSSASVWGGSIPYLQGGITSPEAVAESSRTISADTFRALVDTYNRLPSDKRPTGIITLQNNPAEWLKIISKDSTGYVNTIRVGDKEMKGNAFRYYLLGLKKETSISSHCFTFSYTTA